MTGLMSRANRRLAYWWAAQRISLAPQDSPAKTLRRLLRQAATTRFGRQYDFHGLSLLPDPCQEFARNIPILDYEQWISWLGDNGPLGPEGAKPLHNEAWPGVVDMFCLSSGTTTGRTRFIPYSREMARENRRAALDFFAHAVSKDPGLAPPWGRTLYMSGTTNIQRNQNGALCGDMSGLTKYLATPLLDAVTLPPRNVSSMPQWESRLEAMIKICIERRNITTLSGIPIWQLTLLEKVAERSGKSLAAAMPALRCLIHGGMSLQPYRDRFVNLLGPDALFLETYAASETGIAAYQIPGEAGMRFQEGYGVFYEFQDAAGEVFTSRDVKPHVPYTLLVSSCSGLWRYRIGDIVVFRKTNPLILDYVTRDKTTSAFDEKITEKEVELAMEAMQPSFSDFAMGPDTQSRRHCWFLLGQEQPARAWLEDLDQRLRRNNEDYDDYRGDGRINAPAMFLIPNRKQFLEVLGRVEGGQRKFPRLLSPAEVDKLLAVFEPERDRAQ